MKYRAQVCVKETIYYSKDVDVNADSEADAIKKVQEFLKSDKAKTHKKTDGWQKCNPDMIEQETNIDDIWPTKI